MKKKKVLTTAIVTTLALVGGIAFTTLNTNISDLIVNADKEPYSFTLTKDTTPLAYDSAQSNYYTDVDLGSGYLRRVRADCGRLDSDYLIILNEDEGIFSINESEESGILDNNQIVGLQTFEMAFHLTDSEVEDCSGYPFSFNIYEYDDAMHSLNYACVEVLVDGANDVIFSYNFVKKDCRYFYIQVSIQLTEVRVSSLTITYTCA